ncbi:hypothetical protein [Pasteuria penetrans]|uniref:hypothetical protein n=1 Tax=Pasteuria penetrans TaxID=86005 RepID=UPI000FB9CFB3|nr:hypothetical protein [Pasteuria penetrans]
MKRKLVASLLVASSSVALGGVVEASAPYQIVVDGQTVLSSGSCVANYQCNTSLVAGAQVTTLLPTTVLNGQFVSFGQLQPMYYTVGGGVQTQSVFLNQLVQFLSSHRGEVPMRFSVASSQGSELYGVTMVNYSQGEVIRNVNEIMNRMSKSSGGRFIIKTSQQRVFEFTVTPGDIAVWEQLYKANVLPAYVPSY